MLVFDEANNYTFPNIVINFIDTTYWQEEEAEVLPIPRFNVVIPIHVERGKVNTMCLYKTGQAERFIADFGTPNCNKNGFGPDLVCDILNSTTDEDSGIGVYVCNVRDVSATAANVMLCLKYRIENDVEVTDAAGNPLYLTPAGEVTTSPVTTTQTGDTTITTDNTRLVRDVLHAKYVTMHSTAIQKWDKAMEAMAQEYNVATADQDGYYTIPLFTVVYNATSAFGNNAYFRMVPNISESDNKVYYSVDFYDGSNAYSTEAIMSFSPNGGELIGENYFIEESFNTSFGTLARMVTSNYMADAMDMISSYMSIDGLAYDDIDLFDPADEDGNPVSTGYVVDATSMDSTVTKAFQFNGGSDGDPEEDDADKLYARFFNCEIVEDLASVIRWRLSYIPDIGYDDATIEGIKSLCSKRSRTSVCTIMLGGSTFDSAISEHNSKHIANMPVMRQICALQHAMMYNQYIRRTVEYPAGYLDTMALIRRIVNIGNPYSGFAGYNARWTGYLEDTMTYMPEDAALMNRLDRARVNVLMKDASEGGYLSDQKMNTRLISDQTEFNNALLISDMIYDLIDLIHRNSFNFNEADDVATLKSLVDTSINSAYAAHAASIDIDVYRQGTTGKAKYTNKIEVTVNLKDINKYAIVDFLLTDA